MRARCSRPRMRSKALPAPASVQWPCAAGNPQLAHIVRLSFSLSSDDRGAFFAAERIALPEILCDLLEGRPANTPVAVDVFNQPLEHHNDLRATTHVRMDGEAERRIVHLAVDPVELLAPQVLDVARIDKAVTVRGFFDEHHRRQIVDVPVCGNFNEIDFLTVLKGFHPVFSLLGIVDQRPAVADPCVKWLKVAIALAVIIFESVFLQERRGRRRHLPPWRDVAAGFLAAELLDDLNGFQEDRLLLFGRHRDRVLVRITVRANLVTLLDDLPTLVRKGVDGMPRNEERGLQLVFLEQVQQADDADLACENAALNIGRRVAAAVGADPARHGINIRAKRTDDLFSHLYSPGWPVGPMKPRAHRRASQNWI